MITGEFERPAISPPSSLQTSTSSVPDISLWLRRSDRSLSLLRYKIQTVLITMEEQNQDETIITKQDLEDWLTELEEVEAHIKNLKQNFPTQRD